MAAAAPTKPKVNPLLQLYKEAAWAIKWVAPGLYDELTAPGVDEGAKRERLIEFFQDQGTEQNVVLKDSEGGGAARESVLNDAGKGILETLVTMSEPAAVPRLARGGGGKNVQRAAIKENQEELAKKFAFMLIAYEDGDQLKAVKAVIRSITGSDYHSLNASSFKGMKPEPFTDEEEVPTYPELPSFDQQTQLYEELTMKQDFKQAIFDTLQATAVHKKKSEIFQGLTGEKRKFGEVDDKTRSNITSDPVAQSAVFAYLLHHPELVAAYEE
jgi:hypothetical protein